MHDDIQMLTAKDLQEIQHTPYILSCLCGYYLCNTVLGTDDDARCLEAISTVVSTYHT